MQGHWFRVLFSLGVAMAAVPSAAIEFIPKQQVEVLAKEFLVARVPTVDQIKALSGKELQCDMYGVRTRLQVERNVKLYYFTGQNEQWKNQGAQVVPEYKLDTKGLVGQTGSVIDELRIDQNNQLMAQLSLNSARNSDGKSVVLAYSKCKNDPI